ncbi:MAG: four helix bundle protein [Candidatus Saccharimonadales bacterium]
MSSEQIKSDILLQKAKKYAHAVYSLSKEFPKEEQYGLAAQLRRASISVPLNIVEGYARQSRKTQTQFLTIAYGSLKESQFILEFAKDERYLSQQSFQGTYSAGTEVAKILWTKISTLKGSSV